MFFREYAKSLIERTRDSSRKLEWYGLWADVEGYVIKDPESILRISREEISLGREAKYYKNAASRLVASGTPKGYDEAFKMLKEGMR